MLSLGAFNVDTGEYVHPRFANKKDKYKCPDCGKGLILAKGNIRVHHFRHPKDSVNPCNHYSNPTESQIHKDAKRLIKSLLERKIPISLIRSCVCCEKKEVYEIPEISETSVIQEEWTFEHNGKKKIADVAYLEDGERFCLFEMCYTHKTRSEDRPEPWFEIDAETLIQMVNDNNNSVTSLVIPCIRLEKCEVCIEKEEARRIEMEARTKYEKIEMINKAIEECKKSFVEVDMDWMYEDNKSQKNRLNALHTHLNFVKNDIEYSECGNNIYEIIHPLSKQIVKLSSKNKVFVNGKWNDITFSDIIKWYNNDTNNIIDNYNKKKEIINNGDTLKYALTAINKTERKTILSNYLKKNNIGEINELDEFYFTQIYHKFYSYEDGRSKFNINDIKKVTIESGDYNSKCFNLLVDNKKHTISIKRFN
jgi:uncharacterized protein YkuJ